MKIKIQYSQAYNLYTHDERMIENEANTLRYTYSRGAEDWKWSQYPQVYTTHEGQRIENKANTLRYTLPTRGRGLKIKPIPSGTHYPRGAEDWK